MKTMKEMTDLELYAAFALMGMLAAGDGGVGVEKRRMDGIVRTAFDYAETIAAESTRRSNLADHFVPGDLQPV